MFAKLSTVLLVLPLLAIATPWGSPTTTPHGTTTVTVTATASPTAAPQSQCNTAPVQCCNSVQPASSEAAGLLLGLLGVVLQNLDIPIGLTCSPVTIIGTASSCQSNQVPVCCENNNFSGIIAIGCSPVILNL